MILIINICREKLHAMEFVKPVEDALAAAKVKFFTRHYNDVSPADLKKAGKVIICGTSLKDNEFAKSPEKFAWLKDFKQPVLGICGGMQIIGMTFGAKIRKNTEIGPAGLVFKNVFLGLKGEQEVYCLHNNYADFARLPFNVAASTHGIPQAVKHKTKKIYGVLFHPEVRHRYVITEFAK
jgi:GMP synthase (glutamine-hydrolysing)